MSEFREKIQTLNEQFPGILSDYKKNYDLYYKDTKNQGNLNAYNTSDAQVARCIRDMRDVTVKLQLQNNEFVDIMSQLNTLIADEQIKNTELKDKIERMKNVNNGSSTLVSDYKENYNETNMRNWAIFLGIFAICVSFSNIFIVPTYANSSLILKGRLDKAKEYIQKIEEVAKDLNKKRTEYVINEKVRKENEEYNKEYDKQRLLARAKLDAQRLN